MPTWPTLASVKPEFKAIEEQPGHLSEMHITHKAMALVKRKYVPSVKLLHVNLENCE